MSMIQTNHMIVHSNFFATAIDKRMTVVEQRMLAIYLSKLNPYDIKTRIVSFTLEDYANIMGIHRYNIVQLKACAKKILSTPVIIDEPDGGFTGMPVFEQFDLKNINEKWFIHINCSDRVLPYLFDLKKDFMKYKLWNILNLSEKNHQQMFRILKRFEKLKNIQMNLDEIKAKLDLENNETYKQYKFFRIKVLEPCKKALAENTDICFEYEPIRKGRSVHSIKFTIHKNPAVSSKPLLSEFVASMENNEDSEKQQNSISDIKPFELVSIEKDKLQNLKNEFSQEQLIVLVDLVKQNQPNLSTEKQYNYLQKKYNEMCMRKPNTSRFGYLKKMIESDDQEMVETPKRSFNMELLDRYWDKIPTYEDK